jgi:hypothetical protein
MCYGICIFVGLLPLGHHQIFSSHCSRLHFQSTLAISPAGSWARNEESGVVPRWEWLDVSMPGSDCCPCPWPGPHRCPPHSVPVPLIQGFCCLVLPHVPLEFDCCLIDGNSTASQAPTFKQRPVSPLSSLTSSISIGRLYPRPRNPLSLIRSSSLPHFLFASLPLCLPSILPSLMLFCRQPSCSHSPCFYTRLTAFAALHLALAPNPNLLPAFLPPRVRSASQPPCPAHRDRP